MCKISDFDNDAAFTQKLGSYLSRYYKQMTGKNLIEHLNEVRLNKAKVLLTDKQIRVNDIARMIGKGKKKKIL